MITIIVPTYNERETIIDFLTNTTTQLETAGIQAEVIVVDDNSPDGTAQLVEDFSKDHHNVKLIKRAGKLGLSSACIDGFAMSNSEILGVMDSDLSHSPASLPYLLNPLIHNYCDITVGSRYVPGGRVLNWPLRRYITSRVAGFLGSLLTTIKDPTSGYFFFKRSVIENVNLSPIGFKICLEVLVKGNYQTIKEIPYTFSDRVAGKSKMSANEIINYLKQLNQLRQFRRNVKNINLY